MQKLAAAVVLALLAALAASYSTAAAGGGPVRLQLTHVDAGRGLSQRELLQRMALRSQARAARFPSGSSSASAPVTPGQGTEYLVHFGIGTPPQPVQVTLDTGSDLVWTQCRPCASCFHQALPHFDPSLSSTFAELPCGSSACLQQGLDTPSCGGAAARSSSGGSNRTCVYTISYGDNSTTTGNLDADTFTFGSGDDDGPTAVVVPSISFGCGHNNTGIFDSNETGIAGFGRGALSLPTQLGVHNFSYCFTNITAAATPSPVLLGLPANLYSSASTGAAVQTTPLIQNPASPSFYYLQLRGVTVGSTRLPIPESTFAVAGNGTGGAIIDSGTSMTSLPQDVYNLLTDEFVAQARLPVYNSTSLSQLCFAAAPSSSQNDGVPRLLFHFEGATLDLPRENYMFDVEEKGRSLTCLAVNAGGDLTIIGNYQQQNMHVLYDLANYKLSFVPAQCDRV